MNILQETCYPWKDIKVALSLPRLFHLTWYLLTCYLLTWYLLWLWSPIFSHCGSTYLSL